MRDTMISLTVYTTQVSDLNLDPRRSTDYQGKSVFGEQYKIEDHRRTFSFQGSEIVDFAFFEDP